MKKKVSISIEENKIAKIEGYVREGVFRNKSHVFEFALDKFLEENK